MEQLNEAQGISVAAEIQPCDEVSADISLKARLATGQEIQHANHTKCAADREWTPIREVLYAAITHPRPIRRHCR
jgi:hypothetical protein